MRITKVFGPPGTGKTTAMLEVMELELDAGVPPERLAYLTFTVAARREAKLRALTRFGFEPGQLRWFRTIHSTAYELLGDSRGALVDEGGLAELGKVLGYEFSTPHYTAEGLATFGYSPGDRLMALDHFRRHRCLTVSQALAVWSDSVRQFEARRFVEGYERWRQIEGRMDFTDLLERCDAILPCDVVIVDEAQDLSPLQWRVLWRFAETAQRVYLAGDDDQAIYEWAGAAAGEFLRQPADEMRVLPKSHRCPRVVTALAQRLVAPIANRQPKVWQPRDEEGLIRHVAGLDQLRTPVTGKVFYLVRNRKFLQEIAEHLESEGEPYSVDGRPTIDVLTARAILSWVTLQKGGLATGEGLNAVLAQLSWQQLNEASRQAVSARMESVDPAAESWNAQNVPEIAGLLSQPWHVVLEKTRPREHYLKKVIQRYGIAALSDEPRVNITTIHGVKGAEADHVIILTAITRAVERQLDRDADPERRVWYVGVTRAKQTLTLVEANNPLFHF